MLDETLVVNHSDDMFAPVGLLRVIKCHTEPKTPIAVPASAVEAAGTSTRKETSAKGGEVAERAGGVVDPQAAAEAAGGGVEPSQAVEAVDGTTPSGSMKERQGAAASAFPSPSLRCLPHVHEGSGGLVYLSGVRTSRPTGDAAVAAAAALAAARQTADCLAAALAGLEGVGVSFRDVCFVHLYLRDMGHFSSVNDEYCK